MKLIAHRGNVDGKRANLENEFSYVMGALDKGYDCEIDVWYEDNSFWLGHDTPQYQLKDGFNVFPPNYLPRLWCHAKNLAAVTKLRELGMHWFWHEDDKITITSQGVVWCNKEIYMPESVINQPPSEHLWMLKDKKVYGICADNIAYIKQRLDL